VKREELFLVSKIWPTFQDPEHVEECIRKSLKDWQVDYFDLYLMHFPGALKYVDPAVRYPPGWQFDGKDLVVRSKTTTQQTWQAMEALVEKGLARSIGVSNFQAQLLYDLLRYARIPPATLQVEHHPLYVQPELMKLAKAEGIQVTAYSSFGPMSFLDFDFESAKKMVPLIEDPVIKEIAAAHKRQPAEVLLRWSTQQGLAVIPKVTFPDLMAQNLHHTTFDMTQEELDKISAKDIKFKFNKPTAVSQHHSHSIVPPRTAILPLSRILTALANDSTSSLRPCTSSHKKSVHCSGPPRSRLARCVAVHH
jgi:D-xylose reductase